MKQSACLLSLGVFVGLGATALVASSAQAAGGAAGVPAPGTLGTIPIGGVTPSVGSGFNTAGTAPSGVSTGSNLNRMGNAPVGTPLGNMPYGTPGNAFRPPLESFNGALGAPGPVVPSIGAGNSGFQSGGLEGFQNGGFGIRGFNQGVGAAIGVNPRGVLNNNGLNNGAPYYSPGNYGTLTPHDNGLNNGVPYFGAGNNGTRNNNGLNNGVPYFGAGNNGARNDNGLNNGVPYYSLPNYGLSYGLPNFSLPNNGAPNSGALNYNAGNNVVGNNGSSTTPNTAPTYNYVLGSPSLTYSYSLGAPTGNEQGAAEGQFQYSWW